MEENGSVQLAADEYAAILAVLESIAAAQDVEDYAARVSAGIYRLLPCQGVSCTEVDPVARRVVSEPAPPFPEGWVAQYGPPFEQWAWQHPLAGRLRVGERLGPLVWSIEGEESGFATTELYRAFYAPHGVVSQAVFVFPTEHATLIVITVDCAKQRTCGEPELAILATMAPLLENSYRLVMRATDASREAGRRPEPARNGPAQPATTPAPTDGTVTPPLCAHEVLRARGLTPRQADVALMVASGASTEQIALSLSISVGTVRKHLESVYATLGVSNRAAAAAAVMRLVHPETADILTLLPSAH